MERVPLDRVVFRSRNVAAGLPLVYAFFSTRWEWENEPGVWASALGLCLLGVCLRIWSMAHCDYGAPAKKALAMTGPYRFLRNPLYWGNIFLILGGVAASELFWLIPVAGLWTFAVYHAVVLGEEKRLATRYGREYLGYVALVPRWIPRAPVSSLPRAAARAIRGRLSRIALQLSGFLILIPFAAKEFNLLGFWPHEAKF